MDVRVCSASLLNDSLSHPTRIVANDLHNFLLKGLKVDSVQSVDVVDSVNLMLEKNEKV